MSWAILYSLRMKSGDSAWVLDPMVTFLNHGSFGSCPRPVLETQARLRAELERQPVAFMTRGLEQRLQEVQHELADFLGADGEDLVPVANATSGVNAVLRSYPFSAADAILVTDQEYNACRNVVDFVAARAGAQVQVVTLPFPIQSAQQVVDALTAAVTERTRMLLIDHVTSPTALVLPLEEILTAMQERGVRVLVDGAHGPGQLEVDLGRLGADYYTGNCHKWLNSPKGAGFLWVRPELQSEVRPAVISHGANSPRRDRSRFQLEFAWTGTGDPTPFLSVAAGLRWVEQEIEGGWPGLRRRNRELALAARRLVLEACDQPSPAPDEMIAAMVSLPLPGYRDRASVPLDQFDPLQIALREQYGIELPIFPWGRLPSRALRFSVQHYNSVEDYQLLARALAELGAFAPNPAV